MRYIIGIDLGTTNSCVSYIDTLDPKLSIHYFRLPQLIDQGYVDTHSTLPSFCYLSKENEYPSAALDLPWKKNSFHFVGQMAQIQGSKVPTKLVQSAKSWLCHSAANRRDKILPLEGDEKISPIEATSYYLKHIREAWNHLMARTDMDAEFEQQEIVLTVPASFDEIARRLTVEAAKQAGYIHLTLLEEPQAAFYSWISIHEKNWHEKLKAKDCILVCDVGGGTTDFSLIEVQENGEKLNFNRIAVGEHLLLGGDNMDMAIAHYVERKIIEKHGKIDLQTSQWLQLKHQARNAKETLLDAKTHQNSFNVLLQGTGSSVIKGSLSVQLSRDEVAQFLLEGFFGQYSYEEAVRLKKITGIRTLALPYEEEPSISKHLAAFLKQSKIQKAPEYILFNGGTMKPAMFQQAILKSLATWFPNTQTQVLESTSLDLAVSRGASYYGKVRRGFGITIKSGIPKAYYLGIELKKNDGSTEPKAITLLPRGSEEGSSSESAKTFSLLPNTPVSFTLYTSQVRLNDPKDDVIDIDPKELQPLPSIHTILRFGKKQLEKETAIPVKLNIQLNPIGTLELWLQSQNTEHRWTLEFQLRNSFGQENSASTLESSRKDELFDTSFLLPAQNYLKEIFNHPTKPEKIMEALEKLLENSRKEWSLSVLRGMFDTLLTLSNKRKTHSDLDLRWWNMMGFFMRPGFGYPMDDFRIKELWKIILGEFKTPKSSELLIQLWICYRRIAGGLNKGQQTQIANEIITSLFLHKSEKIILKTKNEAYPYSEKIRAIGSFELLENSLKVKLGNALLSRILEGNSIEADLWALGRIGARHLLYGSIANVISNEECMKWIKALLKLPASQQLAHLLIQLARKTGHREIDLKESIIEEILKTYRSTNYFEMLEKALTQITELDQVDQEKIFGEHLPSGLLLEGKV